MRRYLGALGALILLLLFASLPGWGDRYDLLVGFEVLQLAALAQAWSILAGYGGLVSLAVSTFVGVGAYSAAELSAKAGLGTLSCLLVATATAGLFALVVSVPMFRFRGLYFTIASLVLAEALALFVADNDIVGGNQGVMLGGSAPTDSEVYLLSLAVAALAFVVSWLAGRGKLGLGLRAIRDDEDVAARMGVPGFRVKLVGFVGGAMIMGLVGGIEAIRVGYVQPSGALSLNWSINSVNAAIIGGVATLVGPLLGAGVSVLLSESLSAYPQLHLVIMGVILILVIRLAPTGLWGLVTAVVARYRGRGHPSPVTVRAVPPPPLVRVGEPGEPLLSVVDLGKSYGGVPAVDGVTLDLRSGEVLGIVGPNGAGKSTLIGLLSGAVSGTGSVHYAGADITALGARARAHQGIGRTHQVPRPFEGLTVLDNLLVAHRYRSRSSRTEAIADCMSILDRCGLAEFAHTPASELGLLRLKRLELARALALRPRVLLLDEIGAGLVETELDELIEVIIALREEVESIIIVEHVLDLIRRCCDRLVVLNRGELLLTGTPEEALGDKRVAEVYLGTGEASPEPRPARPSAGVPLLELRGVSAQYGHHRALHEVSLTVGRGEIVALLGANGAGKTTVAKAISGVLPVSGGQIWFGEQRVDGRPAHQLVRLGIAHCMEGRRIFADLTVAENLLLGGRGVPAATRAERLRRMYDLFPDLSEKRGNSGAGLSGGQQQMLAIGRALMSEPSLVIFDEISLGLAPITVDRLYAALRAINETGVTMIVIEQNVERGLALADRVAVLEKGAVALTGTAESIRNDPRLRSLYVGQARS
jgi:ABC-type branched-subunit amino acid transport system ATPase component/ABC-type branched-subunit amino acid transport system permease subunit